MLIIPSIDLRNGQVVRLKQGDYGRQVDYAIDPFQAAQNFAAAGATWMHVVDLDGAKEGRCVQTDLIAQIAARSKLHIQSGGGVRSTADIDKLLHAGVKRVVVGTKALEDWAWFTKLVHEPAYKQKIILALDAKNGQVATRGWTSDSGQSALDVAKSVSTWPLAAILYTDVAKDGMLQGPNLEQTRLIAEAGAVPVIASGGVGNIEHIRQLAKLPVVAAIVGRSLYEGTLDLADAIRAGQSV